MYNNDKNKIVGVVGLGYVGLPLAVILAEAGYNVIGFDLNINICSGLSKGISHIKDIDSDRVEKLIKNGKLRATEKFEDMSKCTAISICVPTPLNKIKDPDLRSVISATKSISKYIIKGQLIILESTTYPGTTSDVLLPILEMSGLKVGSDFYLCFSPERVDPGNIKWTTKNTPKIIGGITKKCLSTGVDYYNKVFDRVIEVESTEAAELIKVFENTFRMVNIALVNELSQICDQLNLNVWNIINAASTKPFGFMKFNPGPGLGGHCIPLDPHYLSWKMRTLSFKTKLIDLASEINSSMPNYIVSKISSSLNSHYKAINGSNILLIGVAYKKDIDDLRESPALEIIKLLQENGAKVNYYDKLCPIIRDNGETYLKDLPLKSIELDRKSINSADIVVIITDHSDIDYKLIKENSKLIIDTRGVYNIK